MSILDQVFDRLALDLYGAEPEVKERLSALGNAASGKEIIKRMNNAHWAMCFLTKAGMPQQDAVEIACRCAEEMLPLSGNSYLCQECIAAARSWLADHSRDNKRLALQAGIRCRDSTVPFHDKRWSLLCVDAVLVPNCWTTLIDTGKDRFKMPSYIQMCQKRLTKKIVNYLEEKEM